MSAPVEVLERPEAQSDVAARWERIEALLEILELRCGTRPAPQRPSLTLVQGGRDA